MTDTTEALELGADTVAMLEGALTHSADAAYSEGDCAAVARVNAAMRKLGMNQRDLSRKAAMSSATVSQVLKLKYPSRPTEFLAKMEATLAVEAARTEAGTPGYVRGSVYKLMAVVCDRTRQHAAFGVLPGAVGVGKTRAIREYMEDHPQTLMIETSPNMTVGVMLTELLLALNLPAPAGLDTKFREAVTTLRGTNTLIVVDEADRMQPSSLEYLRRIRDMAGVGVVLVGTDRLVKLIKPAGGQFDQIRSRVGMWPATIKTITRDDADEMARVGLAEFGELPDDVLDALWAYGAGSARMLMEGLVRNIRDYLRGRAASLTAAHIDQIATTVMFLEKRSASNGRA